jgi:serine/threonine protein kinase/tetratricopeptide (TPR) repeat protein
MQAERWRRVEELYHAAMEQEEGQRAAFLERSCAGDRALRAEVESLIAYARQTGRIIDKPAMEVVAAAMAKDLCAQDGKNLDKKITQNRIVEKTLTSGTKLGDYEVKSLLGSGGMGEVYRARDSRLGRDVAIKVLPSFLSADSERLRRFEQEARAAAALNHPNILAVFQMGTYEGAPYLVSELLEGETLREPIRRGRLAVRKAIDYGVQIARGLAAAHEKGIVHRDLKPENSFVTKDGRVKILDFGLAKLTQPQSGSEHDVPTLTEGTEAGLVMGTVGYMAPEQVRGQAADHRADIFAFGAILYEMLAGKRAFQKPTSPETMTAILNEDPPGISQVATNIPPALQRVVHRCLEKNPEQRFQSASDLAFALDALSDSSGYSTVDVSPAKPPRGPLFWGIGASVVAVALAGSGLLVWHFLDSRAADATPIHSIAVLPFANASKDPEMDYLGEGISEEVTNSLSRLPDLQVMARSVVAHYKSRQDDPQGVGRDLHVDAVLTGRVAEHGSELDVESELVDVSTGAQLWGKRYTRNANDASLLQAAITGDVASRLHPQLSTTERDSLAKVGTRDAEAYRLYLKGRLRFEQGSDEDEKAAVDSFEKAIARDPNYAVAYAGLADAYAMHGYFEFSGREAFDKARSAAKRALELDSQIPESHSSLALVDFLYFWNFAEAEQEIRQALTLDPNSAYAHEVSCWFNLQMGKMHEAITECGKAVELDPLSLMYNDMLGEMYFFSRNYNLAIEQENKALGIDPQYRRAVFMIGYGYEQLGDYKKAMEQWIKDQQLQGHETRAKEMMQVFEKSGYPGYLKKDAKDNEAGGDYFDAADDYAMLGQKDAAFALLEKAFPTRAQLLLIKVDPDLDNIRSDPRYADLLRRIGLPQ